MFADFGVGFLMSLLQCEATQRRNGPCENGYETGQVFIKVKGMCE
jgi:hypothetical protein